MHLMDMQEDIIPLIQLEVSKSSIEDLFEDLLNKVKGFKYQITLAVLLSKIKTDGSIEYSPVYFNSTTKTGINSDEFGLINHFKKFCTEYIFGLIKDQDGLLNQ